MAEAINKGTVIKLLKQDLVAIFTAYQQGRDVPPAQRYKWEGLAELALSQALITEADMAQLQQDCYQQVNGQPLAGNMPAGLVPALMVRAPVKPSTK